MKRILIFIIFLSQSTTFAQSAFESSKGKKTGTYQEVISYYAKLTAASPAMAIKQMGSTDSNLPLHLVIVDMEQDFNFEKAREKGKTVVLINNGIHPGEPDGIEACQLLLKNINTNKAKQKLLKNIVLAIIPIYNIGGALNRNSTSRVNQNGPETYGFRGNARNFDLNRDFIKADTKNSRSFYEIFHAVKPDIFIDTHVSNGADYQYSITHLATQHNKIGGEMGKYIKNTFTPKMEKLMRSKGSEITPYVNVFNTTPDSKGITQFLDGPRYSTGYAALFNTLGFMVETHMLKPFDIRVKATYDFLESVLEIAATDGDKIERLHQGFSLVPGNRHPISWKVDRSAVEQREFKGYEGEMVNSIVTGKKRLYYNRDKPFTKEIPYYSTYVAAKQIVIPKAYIIPQGWFNVINRLKWNDLQYEQLKQDTVIQVERYRIETYDTSPAAYEGHYPHSNVEVQKEHQHVKFRAGDYIFSVEQSGGRYLIETLEPEAPDSFFSWNFFDTILQQKEHFSPYVFEAVARQLLEDNPTLKEKFQHKKETDKEFANSSQAQLTYLYKNSPYYEAAHLQYPIYRLME